MPALTLQLTGGLLTDSDDGEVTSTKYEHRSPHKHVGGGGFSQQHLSLPATSPPTISGPPLRNTICGLM